jgi:hypothetical protein
VTTARRLEALEAALSPTELVLRWLTEAQAYDDFGSYFRTLLDVDPDDFPMDRLAREAREGAKQRSRGLPRAEADRAVRRATIEACVRVQLVLRINEQSQAFLDREGLILTALTAHVGLVIGESAERLKANPLRLLVQDRDLLLGRVTELHSFETGRIWVEARYLAGMAADFPAARRAWRSSGRAPRRWPSWRCGWPNSTAPSRLPRTIRRPSTSGWRSSSPTSSSPPDPRPTTSSATADGRSSWRSAGSGRSWRPKELAASPTRAPRQHYELIVSQPGATATLSQLCQKPFDSLF